MKPFKIVLAEIEYTVRYVANGNYYLYASHQLVAIVWPHEFIFLEDSQFWLADRTIDPDLLQQIGLQIESYHLEYDE